MNHEPVQLAQAIDRPVLEERFGTVYPDGRGMPPLPLAGLANLSTRSVCRTRKCAPAVRRSPYLQYLCGEEFFRHEPPPRKLMTLLGRTIRDASRQIVGRRAASILFQMAALPSIDSLEGR
ncbi:hypothetical protein BQ8482_760005 [Mesorhizobium delmotii]|uniref:Uncharacterized protein n=1 Tax=Mesorhizobium delmotii TaxID=1631247 RepID=A0A2P9AW11_9HYPH|nr:hypothetical protein BQ8482_760005 [Mesorhizobium delmotii]